MAERPDLGAYTEMVDRAKLIRNYGLCEQALDKTLTYCRELEAENKRLRKRCVELAREFEIDLVKRMSE